MNLSKELKKKRDAEDRLRQSSPQKVFFPDGFIDLSQFANKNHTHKFIDLTDAPNNYVADKFVKVNADGTALEYGDGGGGGISEIPQATESVLGGIKAAEKTTETAEVKIDTATGKLYAPAPDEATNGLPAGGTTGQILSKIDGTDYNSQWIDAPSGGGDGVDTPPSTPSSWDDEFNSTVLNNKWIWINQIDSTVNLSEYDGKLKFITPSSTTRCQFLTQPRPTGNFEITAKLNANIIKNYAIFGIALINSATGASMTAGVNSRNNKKGAGWIRWSTFTSGAGNFGVIDSPFTVYVKIQVINTTMNIYFLFDSIFQDLVYTGAVPDSFDKIGFGGNPDGVVGGFIGLIDWFRVEEL